MEKGFHLLTLPPSRGYTGRQRSPEDAVGATEGSHHTVPRQI
jgi:hypothetical protein